LLIILFFFFSIFIDKLQNNLIYCIVAFATYTRMFVLKTNLTYSFKNWLECLLLQTCSCTTLVTIVNLSMCSVIVAFVRFVVSQKRVQSYALFF
jgi:hypothetical protein